jgi:hypothetical protein
VQPHVLQLILVLIFSEAILFAPFPLVDVIIIHHVSDNAIG